MTIETNDLTEAEAGDEIETDSGPATVLAVGSGDEVVAEIERLIEEGR